MQPDGQLADQCSIEFRALPARRGGKEPAQQRRELPVAIWRPGGVVACRQYDVGFHSFSAARARGNSGTRLALQT